MNSANQSNTNSRPKVIVERTYRADVRELWELWTTKDGFESWWGPVDFHAKVHTIEARLGGTLHYDMIAGTPAMVEAMRESGRPASHPARATFSTFQPNERLVLTSMIDFLPDVKPYEASILVELFVKGPDVTMRVTFDPMHSEEFSQMQKEGFTSQLSKLDARFPHRS